MVDSDLLVVITDCGSTTTKARAFRMGKERWEYIGRGEAPTTVEEPVADVTIGVRNALTELEEAIGRSLGSYKYLSTSSAGGGLQMIVMGGVRRISLQSAERAALGAGAIILDSFSIDDPRDDHERISSIKHLKPDIVLISGGTDGGASYFPLYNAEILRGANPKPRFGDSLKVPVVYAGNNEIAQEIDKLLNDICDVHLVGNVRAVLESENVEPARDAIHELFLSHVMSHSPGYKKLMNMVHSPILPTPTAVGNIIKKYSENHNKSCLCVDIGGATTDIFSMFRGKDQFVFNRTVSANFGMSYSIAYVLLEAGLQNVVRWLPVEVKEVRNRIRNKMIRPTTLPQGMDELWIEQAMCREALRLSFDHHRSLAVSLSGITKRRTIGDLFKQEEEKLVDLMKLDCVIGSGGVISHAPDRKFAALMLLDGFALEGVTELFVDDSFLLPHLGVFAEINEEAAFEVLEFDCLKPIGTTVAPKYKGKPGTPLAQVFFNGSFVGEVIAGSLEYLKLPKSEGRLEVIPRSKKVNVSGTPGEKVVKHVSSSELFLDGRNRPLIEIGEETHKIMRELLC